MNWKREAIDKLKNYEAHKLALESLPKEIRRLESAYTGIRSATTDGTPISGGGRAGAREGSGLQAGPGYPGFTLRNGRRRRLCDLQKQVPDGYGGRLCTALERLG